MDDEFEGAEYGAGFRVNMGVRELNGDGDVGFMYGRGKSAQNNELDIGAFLATDDAQGESSGEASDGDENLWIIIIPLSIDFKSIDV